MRWKDILEAAGVGRITKQNQTPDVGPGEVKRQAAKFGNKVDKDGVPPTLSKKVKGKSTNVLFNLGLAEDSTQEGKMIPNPANTFIAKADTAYDHYKLGTNMANLKDVPKGANYDEPDVVIAPYAGKKEMKYLQKQLTRIGYDVQDADGYYDTHFDDKPTDGKAPPQVKNFGPLGRVPISKLKGVQKERSYKKLAKQLERVLDDDYAPLQIDRRGRVVNGHHRLDALRLVGEEYARVYMADDVVENMLDETYADDKREKTKRQLAKHDKAMVKSARDSIKKYEKDKEQKTDENFADGKKFVEPNFSSEWEEAERYPEFQKIGKEAWIELAKKGKEFTIKSAKGINNTDAADPDSFKSLDPNKQKRALAQLEKGTIEMPIVAVYSDGHKELVGGNTRLTAMMAKNDKATVWAFNVPDEVAELAENFADGKKKGKSRPGRVKKSGASCNGSVTELRKKAKNASGERAKMYHWCANMKGGKKK